MKGDRAAASAACAADDSSQRIAGASEIESLFFGEARSAPLSAAMFLASFDASLPVQTGPTPFTSESHFTLKCRVRGGLERMSNFTGNREKLTFVVGPQPGSVLAIDTSDREDK